jgi:hypothetical protein
VVRKHIRVKCGGKVIQDAKIHIACKYFHAINMSVLNLSVMCFFVLETGLAAKLPGWSRPCDLPASASQVARISGLCYHAQLVFLK